MQLQLCAAELLGDIFFNPGLFGLQDFVNIQKTPGGIAAGNKKEQAARATLLAAPAASCMPLSVFA